MDILGSIGSLAKVVTDPGSLVQDLANSVLPKELSGVVGNLAAGAVDYCTGNEVMAAKHGLSALTDLPQLAGTLTKQTSGGTARFEPSPPKSPTASGTWRGSPTMEASIASLLQQLRALGLNVTINVNGTPGQDAATANAGQNARPHHHHPHHPKVPSSPKFDTSTAADASSPTGSAGKAVSADNSAKASPSDSTGKTSTTDTAAKTDASGSSGKSSSADSSAKKGSTDSTPALAALDKMSDTDFMNAIKSGNLDKSIKDDPAAMRAIQARMDAISQMNQLLTSMMQAMHQMQMAVIQNIRV